MQASQKTEIVLIAQIEGASGLEHRELRYDLT
jgi:hypothetical protein